MGENRSKPKGGLLSARAKELFALAGAFFLPCQNFLFFLMQNAEKERCPIKKELARNFGPTLLKSNIFANIHPFLIIGDVFQFRNGEPNGAVGTSAGGKDVVKPL